MAKFLCYKMSWDFIAKFLCYKIMAEFLINGHLSKKQKSIVVLFVLYCSTDKRIYN